MRALALAGSLLALRFLALALDARLLIVLATTSLGEDAALLDLLSVLLGFAEAVLALADERARIAGCLPVRWVDDVVFAGDPAAVHRAWRAWTVALGELGLREHEGKRSTGAPAIGHGSLDGAGRRDIMRGS